MQPLPNPPIVALLSHAKARFICEFDARMRHSAYPDLLLAHSSNVLRWLHDGPVRASHLVECSGVTKQAISQQLVLLAERGYITITPDPADHRAKLVALSERGVRAQDVVHALFSDIEDEWLRSLGEHRYEALTDALLALAHQHPGADPCQSDQDICGTSSANSLSNAVAADTAPS